MQNASQRAAARTHSKGLADNFRKYWPYYVMAMPGVIYLIIFRFIPIITFFQLPILIFQV